ncbi:hypothetical protein E3N88_30006 [Mikania micrantha]|uniref:Flavodoxin-like domain-containing protein n=1 Tax=Mikania micrantha TaxID=192012 RepID=A0A5N6MKU6_9ASTR|nr:hypothetical protein E3N88_30006 [Mikania micrantha]
MGKGGGCVPSKKRPPAVDSGNAPASIGSPTNAAEFQTIDNEVPVVTIAKLKILIVFYSMYGHVEKLARRVKKGVDGVDGVEAVFWTAITQLAHHGMLFVPIGYTFGANMFKMDSVRGGTPYGAGVFAGDGTRDPSETELALAEHQGKYMAGVVKKLAQV